MRQLSLFDNLPPPEPQRRPGEALGSPAPARRPSGGDTIVQLLPEYRRYLTGSGRAESTVADFVGDLEQLAAYFPDRAVASLTTADLAAFLGYLRRDRGRALKTIERKTSALKSFFAYLAERGVCARDPARFIAYPRLNTPLPVVLSGEADAERLLAALAEPMWRALALVFLDAGLKRDEALRLRWDDLRLEGTLPYLAVRRPPTARYGESRTVPLTSRLVTALRSYLEHPRGPGPLVFPLAVRSVAWRLERAGKEAGLTTPVSAQVLRDTFAVRWLAEHLAGRTVSPAEGQRLGAQLLDLLGLSAATYEQVVPKYLALAAYWRPASETPPGGPGI